LYYGADNPAILARVLQNKVLINMI